MKIERVVWLKEIVDKLARKHHVLPEEVEQAAQQQAKILSRAERGTRRGGRVHGFRQTDAGRYLTVLFIYKKKAKEALILSARDMAKKERKRYEKKR